MSYSGNTSVARFKTDMLDIRRQLVGSYEQNLTRLAEEIMDNMRAVAPKRTGHLKESIRRKNITVKFGNRQRVTVLILAGGQLTTHPSAGGHPYDYALADEFGTEKMKAEPFFYSTFRMFKQAGNQMARETLDEAIKENNRMRQARSDGFTNAGMK